MKEKIECGFAAGWKDWAPGTFKLIRHGASESPDPILTDHFSPHADGKGMIESFSLYEGIELSFQRYMADQVRFHHEANNAILEINYCRRGRMGLAHGQRRYGLFGSGRSLPAFAGELRRFCYYAAAGVLRGRCRYGGPSKNGGALSFHSSRGGVSFAGDSPEVLHGRRADWHTV